MGTIEGLAQIARARPEKIRERKKKGFKIVGFIDRFVPRN
jgi:hypothetical protein